MAAHFLDFDVDRAVNWLMRFLAVEGVTGKERAIGEEVVNTLREVGVPRSAITFDQAHQKIPLPTETGNLIVKLDGTRKGPRRMFMTHLDTVPLCAGAVPLRKGNRIVAAGPTALGGDNRTGVACLVNVIASLIEERLPHPPLTFLFTVREESGLWGARFVNLKDLGKPEMCFNVDGGPPGRLSIGAVGADRWAVEIRGKASHAGVHPEEGISATMVAALALAEVHRGGWFGRIIKDGRAGTSNVGSIGDLDGRSAGVATNVVTDYALVRGESRSHDARFISEITRAYRDAFQQAARKVVNAAGKTAKVTFRADRDYYPFRLAPNSPVVRQAQAAADSIELATELRLADGGLDANWLVRHGIPTVTFGAGQNKIHTVDEYVELKDFETACRFALALATLS